MGAVNDFIQSTQTVVEDLKKLGDAAGYKAPLPTPVQPSPYARINSSMPWLLLGGVALLWLFLWKKSK